MANFILNRRSRKENFLIVILLIFTSSQATLLSIAPLTTVISFVYISWIFYKRKVKADRFFLWLLFFYSTINIFYQISFGSNDFLLSFYILLKLCFAYASIKILRESFFPIYEKVILYLAIISFPFFLIQLWNFDFLYNSFNLLRVSIPALETVDERIATIFIFSLKKFAAELRNSGFAWEPKGFSNFLILAILFNIVSNQFKINLRLVVLTIALLTTASTTGYIIIFGLFPVLYLINSKSKNKLLYFPAILIGIFLVFNLDFGFAKIQSEFEGRDRYTDLLTISGDYEKRSLGRFPSLIVDFKDFLKRPFFGYGFNREFRTQNAYTKLVRVNGASDILAVYGAVGFLVIFGFNYLSFKNYLQAYSLKGSFVVLVMLLVIYFATNLISHPLWMVFYFSFLNKLSPFKLNIDYIFIFKRDYFEKLRLSFKKYNYAQYIEHPQSNSKN